MTTVERILELCKEKSIPVYKLEQDLGFSNAYIRRLNEGKIPADRLFQIAEYFRVSPEYLMTGEHPEQKSDSGRGYYFSDETAEAAQEIFDDPDLHALFDAAKDSTPENLKLAAELLKRLKATNPEG